MNSKTAAWILLGTIAASMLGNAARIRELASKLGSDWSNLHPDMKARALEVIDLANKEFAGDGLRVGIHDGWRDVSESLQQIREGDSFVSHPLHSYHPWGLAADFVFITRTGEWSWLPNPKNPNDRDYIDPRWYRLGAIIEAVGLEWGGRWPGKQFDGPHGQLEIARPRDLRQAYADDPLAFINANAGGVFV